MPGIFVSSYPGVHSPDGEYQKNLIRQEMITDSYVIERNTLNKYMNDKLFFENEQLIILLDGVILNKSELCHMKRLPIFIIQKRDLIRCFLM